MSKSIITFVGMLSCLAGWQSSRAAPSCQVDVVVDLTPDARKLTLPVPGKPIYYFPVVGGYHESGAVTAGEKAPPKLQVIHLLAKALAEQGYVVCSKETATPSLLLVFHWGYMNPQIDDFGSGDPSQKVFFNQRQMLGLVAGHTLNNLDLSFEREDVMQAAEDNRYFVVVAAYDFAAALKHQKKMLWCAKMSTPSNGVTIDEVIPSLISSGAPQFGRETNRPKWIKAPVSKTPKVELGTPEVKGYVPDEAVQKRQDPAEPSAPEPSAPSSASKK